MTEFTKKFILKRLIYRGIIVGSWQSNCGLSVKKIFIPYICFLLLTANYCNASFEVSSEPNVIIKQEILESLTNLNSEDRELQKKALNYLENSFSTHPEETKKLATTATHRLVFLIETSQFIPKRSDEDIRYLAVNILSRIGMSEELSLKLKSVFLEELKRYKGPEKRKKALQSLSILRIFDEELLEICLNLLNDKYKSVREQAVQTLSSFLDKIGELPANEKEILTLIEMVKDQDPFLKQEALRVLSLYTGGLEEYEDIFIESLDDDFSMCLYPVGSIDFHISEGAVKILQRLNTPKALKALEEYHLKDQTE